MPSSLSFLCSTPRSKASSSSDEAEEEPHIQTGLPRTSTDRISVIVGPMASSEIEAGSDITERERIRQRGPVTGPEHMAHRAAGVKRGRAARDFHAKRGFRLPCRAMIGAMTRPMPSDTPARRGGQRAERLAHRRPHPVARLGAAAPGSRRAAGGGGGFRRLPRRPARRRRGGRRLGRDL